MNVTTLQAERHEPAAGFRRFGVSPEALAQGRDLGLTESELADKARRSARFRDTHATHRFDDLAFVIANDTVVAVRKIFG